MSRLLIAESVEPELAEVVRSVREARAAYPIGLVRAAIARGELPRGTAPRLVVEVLMGALYYDLLVGEVPSAARIERVVDLVLDGARGGAAAKSAARGGGRAGA